MPNIPHEQQRELEALIREGLPAEQIAFVMRLDIAFVKSEIARLEREAAHSKR